MILTDKIREIISERARARKRGTQSRPKGPESTEIPALSNETPAQKNETPAYKIKLRKVGGGKLGKEYIPESELQEELNPSMGPGAYIRDFIASKNPRFKGKTKKERIKMALGAYYDAKRDMKEEKKNDDPCWGGYEQYGTKKKNGKTVPNCVPVKK